MHRSKARGAVILLLALLLAALVGAQLWLLRQAETHLPQAVEFEDTQAMQAGWAATQKKVAETQTGLCTPALQKEFSAGGQSVTLPVCRANAAFGAAQQLDFAQGAFWQSDSAAPALVLPEALARQLGVAVGDRLTGPEGDFHVMGIYRPWQLPGTRYGVQPVYTNVLTGQDELALQTLRILVPLPGSTLETTALYELFMQTGLSPHGRSMNLRNLCLLLGQLVFAEGLLILLLPVVWLTVRGGAGLCRLILPTGAQRRQGWRGWAAACGLALAPSALFGLLLGRMQIPGEFLPAESLFDTAFYTQVAQSMLRFTQSGYGFSPAVEQYLLALGYMALLAVPVLLLGWALAVLLLKRRGGC